MAEKKKLSVQEILAAARKQDAGKKVGGESEPAAAPPTPPSEPKQETPAPANPAAETPKSATAKPAVEKSKPAAGGRPSVAEMIAQAKANKGQGGASSEPAAAAVTEEEAAPVTLAEKPKPATKPVAAKTEPKAAAVSEAAPSSGRSTASILDAARAGKKLGPMSKAEATSAASSTAGSSASPRAPVAEMKPAKAKPSVPPMPSKPDYAKKPDAKTAATENRRSFMAILGMAVGSFLAAGFTAMAGTFGLWTLGFARFMFPNILTEPPSRFKIGLPAEYPPGKVDERFKSEFGVWVVHADYNGQPQIFALSTTCTHLGCTPNWLEAEQKFKCPCHGSGFYKDGINFEGPAPRPLERHAIAIAGDGQLEVDKSRIFQEEKGEWSSPDCFVPV